MASRQQRRQGLADPVSPESIRALVTAAAITETLFEERPRSQVPWSETRSSKLQLPESRESEADEGAVVRGLLMVAVSVVGVEEGQRRHWGAGEGWYGKLKLEVNAR